MTRGSVLGSVRKCQALFSVKMEEVG